MDVVELNLTSQPYHTVLTLATLDKKTAHLLLHVHTQSFNLTARDRHRARTVSDFKTYLQSTNTEIKYTSKTIRPSPHD